MSDGVKVRVIPPGGDYTDPLQQDYKLYVFEKRGGITTVWRTFGWDEVNILEASEYPPPTLRFPAEAAAPMFEALREALGMDKPVESDVLREALTIERGRVDDVLQAIAKRI